MLAVYVHIPFCKQKCKYCDFNSYSGLGSFYQAYIDALVTEIALQAPRLGSPNIGSIYIGGGTPTLMEPSHIEAVLLAIDNHFSTAKDIEVSVEANPETVTADRMAALREAGVNRLSIGFQSLDDKYLQILGRKHSAQQAVDAFNAARGAGFDNINIDLIFGIPGQSVANWALTLEQVASLDPEHISSYGLTIESKTVLEREIDAGLFERPDEDLQADMLVYTMDSLEESGFDHYEISNYAKPGRKCRHNLAYWNNDDYIGFGAGAHSKVASTRFSNVTLPEDYIKRASTGSFIAENVDLSVEDEISETLFLGLRRMEGVDLVEFEARFGKSLHDIYGTQVDELVKDGLVIAQDDRLRLTPRGILFGNEVFSRFV